jgi:hypothetical protein
MSMGGRPKLHDDPRNAPEAMVVMNGRETWLNFLLQPMPTLLQSRRTVSVRHSEVSIPGMQPKPHQITEKHMRKTFRAIRWIDADGRC